MNQPLLRNHFPNITQELLTWRHSMKLGTFGTYRSLHTLFGENRTWEYRKKEPKATLESWEELRAYQPRVPHPCDYEWPKDAPDPLETPRERFHEFMRGRPLPFSPSVGSNLYRNCGWLGCGLIFYAGFRIMRGDDFQWIDEERKRIAKAKKKLEKVKKYQEKQRKSQRAQAIEADKIRSPENPT